MTSCLDPDVYLERCCALLTKWNWLYRERATHVLVSGLLDSDLVQPTLQCMKSFDKQILTKIPQGYYEEEWPEDLKHFIKECFDLRLDVPLFEAEDNIQLAKDFYRGMSPKKKDEVTKLGALVARVCRQASVTVVVDVGSGLGYIDRLLSWQYGLSVIGLERDLARVRAAEGYGGEVEYLEADLREDTLAEVTTLVTRRLGGRAASVICLHACGDLSIRTESLFRRLAPARCMVNVPCCYHLGALYPVSVSLRQTGLVTPNLLRLASESSADRWSQASPDQHTTHAMALLARAALQCFTQNEGVRVEKSRRRLVRRADRCRNWTECLEEVCSGLEGLDKGRLSQAWPAWGHRLPDMEAYLCLQASLQATAEGLLLTDRLRHLTDNGLTKARLIRVFKPRLSPRSIAIVAFKQDAT